MLFHQNHRTHKSKFKTKICLTKQHKPNQIAPNIKLKMLLPKHVGFCQRWDCRSICTICINICTLTWAITQLSSPIRAIHIITKTKNLQNLGKWIVFPFEMNYKLNSVFFCSNNKFFLQKNIPKRRKGKKKKRKNPGKKK